MNSEQHMSTSEKYLREKSLEKAEKESGGNPMPGKTVPYEESKHPSVMAQKDQEERPRSRYYGDSDSPINDAVGFAALAECRKMLGMKPREES